MVRTETEHQQCPVCHLDLKSTCWNLEPAGPEKPPLRQTTRSIRTARTIPDLSCLSLGEKIVSTGNECRLHIGVGIECVAQPLFVKEFFVSRMRHALLIVCFGVSEAFKRVSTDKQVSANAILVT